MTLRMAFWLCLFLLVPWRTWGAEGEWSRFRGPNGSGISEATTIPVHWTEKDYNWKIALPGIGHSSPVVWGQRIFVTCGDPVTAQRLILCLDTATGRKIWQRHLSLENLLPTPGQCLCHRDARRRWGDGGGHLDDARVGHSPGPGSHRTGTLASRSGALRNLAREWYFTDSV